LKKPFFVLLPAAQLNIDRSCLSEGLPGSMIVCSCNVISDHDIRNAVSNADELPRNARDVYGCLGCSAECGRCARTIKTIVDQALGPCARRCQVGCGHDRTVTAQDEPVQERFALAAA
jgi:bacterioferritin-associated ferredoxin